MLVKFFYRGEKISGQLINCFVQDSTIKCFIMLPTKHRTRFEKIVVIKQTDLED